MEGNVGHELGNDLVAAQLERPLVPARVLSIASAVNANSLKAL